ncbi:hypothetical protein INT45_007163 [Circinella minor]|uniref:Retrotransposon gag domain-containing protein n=1 Tax=Circinella minor TaxID=1195481 RepID=A0A8H7RTP3_9FUNG|nr:hypothetical protein INT45_007163 [Circinella minor]
MTMLQSLQQIMQQQQQQAEQIANLRTQSTRPTAHTDDQQSLVKIIRPRQLDTFYGERTVQQVEAWLYSLEKYAEFVNIDDHQMVLFAVTLLHDGAATWWRGVEYDMTTSTPSTWSEFKHVFKYEFKPANAEQQLARQRLQQLQQTSTVEQYVHEFRSLMPELPDMNTKDALFNFMQGLKYQCRLQVLMQKPFSLSEAYAYAEAYETAEQCAKIANRRPTNFSPFNKSFGQLSSSYVNQGPTPIDLDATKLADSGFSAHAQSVEGLFVHQNSESLNKKKGRWWTKGSESRKKGTLVGLTRCDQTTRSTPSSVHEIQVPSSVQKSSSMCQKSMVEATEGGQHKEDTDHGDILELRACKDGSESLLLYDGSCAGKRMLVLLNSGASSSYISPNMVKNLEMVQVEAREVETAGGHRLHIDKMVNVDFNLDGCNMTIKAYILDTKFDFVLGRNWLQKYTPDVDWLTDNWNVKINGETKILKPVRYLGESGLRYLLLHKQINRAIRHKEVEEVYLLHLLESDIKENKIPEELQLLVNEYQEIFRDELPGLPPDRGFKHVIDTGDEKPVSRPPYKMSTLELDELRRQLNKLLELGLVVPSLATNKKTIRINAPLPRIDECLERLQGAKYFTSLDLKSGYHQIKIRELDIPKTAFNTRYGQYSWKVLPFGLCNAPPSFQALMNKVLGDLLDRCYKLRDNELYANYKKCEFGKEEITFLGFRVSTAGILPASDKVKAIQEWKPLNNVQEVGFLNFRNDHFWRGKTVERRKAVSLPLS